MPIVGSYQRSRTTKPRGVLADQSNPINHGLEGMWLANEAAGSTVYDITGRGRDGTLTHMDPAVDWVSGKFGSALNFDGTDTDTAQEHVLISSNFGITTAVPHTFLAWVNLDSASEGGAFIKLGRALSPGNRDGWAVGVGGSTFDNTGNNLIGLIEGVRWIDSNINIGTGWHQIGYRYLGTGSTSFQLILDGRHIFSGSAVSSVSPVAQTTFGAYVDGSEGGAYPRAADCQMDHVRLYKRGLRNAEIARLFADPLAGLTMPSRFWFVPAAAPGGNLFVSLAGPGGLAGPAGRLAA